MRGTKGIVVPALFLLAITLLYAAALQAYYVGFFNDDAYFLIGARSLLQGSFSELNHPLRPALISYMPGYPAILAFIAAFRPATFVPYQILSIMISTTTVGFLFLLLRTKVEKPVLIGVVLMVALNPLTVSLSATVLSDMPYLLATLIFFLMWGRINGPESISLTLQLTLMAVAAFYIRPLGALLVFVIWIHCLRTKKWNALMVSAVVFIMLVAPFLIRNQLAKGVWLSYGAQYLSPFESGFSVWDHVVYAASNAGRYLSELFGRTFFRWPFSGSDMAWNGIAGVLGLGCAAWGWRSVEKTQFWDAVKLYVGAYGIAVLFWRVHAVRYMLPLLPWAAFFFLVGVQRLFPLPHRSVVVITALFLFLSFKPVSHVIHVSLFELTPVNTPPLATVKWIQVRTQEDDVLAAKTEASLSLLSGRRTVVLPRFGSGPDAEAWARANRVRWIMVEESDFLLKTREDLKAQADGVNGLWPSAWPLVYANPEERARIYRVDTSTSAT